ncbi:MAG: thiamine-phosphate kinase [Acidobacteria bacterium]|nr:thiamine-phosphate kinase [Acidobacteriota bacterium]
MPSPAHPRTPPKLLGERRLIELIRTRASKTSSAAVQLGIGDDCAILKTLPGHELLVTTDFSLEGRHFRRDWHSSASVGHRTLARGLSDLAAMGATPIAAFLSLALPRSASHNSHWINNFLDGLLSLARTYKLPLAGGDTSESPSEHILADILLLGSAPAGRALRRSGCQPGDLLYCTGSLGGAAAELSALAAAPLQFRRAQPTGDHPHLFPQPRLAVGSALLRRRLATACIDISDGLSTDLSHLCTASSVAAELDTASLPIHPLAQRLTPDAALRAALHGGEDYELLFTAPASIRLPRSIANVRITPIGRILPARKSRPQITLFGPDGHRSALAPQGWEHLA